MAFPPQRLLHRVVKPARYTGGEWNILRKPWDSAGLRVCLVYPDLYEVGAVRSALNSLYQRINGDPAILAERVFAPWPDFAQALRSEHLALSSLESGRPLGDFDILAVCYPSELAATTILEMLDLARLPLVSSEREARHPLVVGWEERPANPEPLAEVFDAYLVGDAEVAIHGLVEAWRNVGGQPGRPPDRATLLRRVASEPGIYVPSLYEPRYSAGGTYLEAVPQDGAPAKVGRPTWHDLLPAPLRPVVPYLQSLPDRAIVEIQRGCGPTCLSARLGLTSPPLRQRPSSNAVASAREMLRATGYEEVTLGASCLRDFAEREQLFAAVRGVCAKMTATVRLPPLPLDLLTPSLAASLQEGHGTGTLALGPEVANDDLISALGPDGALAGPVELLRSGAAGGSFKNLRVEVILGHPTATDGGWQAAALLLRAIRQAVGPQARIRVDASFFVRRPFTPWQWTGQPPLASLEAGIGELRRTLGRRAGLLSEANPARAQVEAALACGDRRLGAVVRHAWSAGSVMDTSEELFRADRWQQAFATAGLDLETSATASQPVGLPLPWSHLDGPDEAGLAALLHAQARAVATGGDGT